MIIYLYLYKTLILNVFLVVLSSVFTVGYFCVYLYMQSPRWAREGQLWRSPRNWPRAISAFTYWDAAPVIALMFITQLLIIAFVPHILPFQSFRCVSTDRLNSACLTFLIPKIEKKNRNSTFSIWDAVGNKWSSESICVVDMGRGMSRTPLPQPQRSGKCFR